MLTPVLWEQISHGQATMKLVLLSGLPVIYWSLFSLLSSTGIRSVLVLLLFNLPKQLSTSKHTTYTVAVIHKVKSKGSPYSITERRVPELIPVLGSQPAGDASHKPGGMLPLLSVRPAVTLTTLTRAATNFAAWWTGARWVWTVCPRLLPDSIATAILTRALLRLSPAR